MKISVVIPTRHRNQTLAQCLERLAPGRQTLGASDYEVIVTDDGSTSTAEAMMRERYPWVRWVAGPRKGPAANRNNGARAANGRWLAFTDDDCLPANSWLAAFVGAIQSGTDVYEGKTTSEAGVGLLQEAPVNLTGGNLWSCNFMIARELFQSVRGFEESFPAAACEDMDFNNRLRQHGHQPQFVPEAVIDHPPRPRALGWRAGLRWESRVLLSRLEGNTAPSWTWMLTHLLRYRAGEIRRHPLGWQSVVAAASAALEFCSVAVHVRGWDRKYRAFMAKHDPSLPSGITAAE